MLGTRNMRPFILVTMVMLALTPAHSARGQYRGREFPDFTATDALTGEKFSLADLRGKVVIIDFWATWCGPCVKELPNVKSVHRKYRDKGLVIVSISLDKDRRRFESFARRQKMTWYHVMEGGGWETRLARQYNIRSIPAMFVLDHNGVCIAQKPRGRVLEQAVKEAIGKLPGTAAAPALPEPRGVPAPAPEKLDEEIRAARNAVQAAAATLRPLSQKLDEAGKAIDTLDGELPLPRRPEVTRNRYEKLCRTLHEVRQELFVTGHLNDRPIALPVNPFVGDEVDVDRAMIAAKGQIEPARRAVSEMEVVIVRLKRQIDKLDQDLRLIERRREREKDPADRCRTIRQDAEILRYAWRNQLRDLDGVMADLTGASPAASGLCDELTARIESCRERLSASGRDARVQEQLREDFAAVCEELNALAANLKRMKAAGADDVDLPSNPFQNGSLRDVRSRIEAERQLEKADAAVEQIRRAMQGVGGRFADLAGQLEEMQAELDGAADDSAKLDDLEKRFRTWSQRFLAVLDGGEGGSS